MPDAASDLYHLFGFAFTNISPSLLTGDFQLSYCTYMHSTAGWSTVVMHRKNEQINYSLLCANYSLMEQGQGGSEDYYNGGTFGYQ